MELKQNEDTRATDANIVKYLAALLRLHTILCATNRVSMMKFSIDNSLSKNLSTVLSKGGVIKCIKKGKFSEWEWCTIPPNKHMAIKVLKEFAILNPERRPYEKKVSVVNARVLESYNIKLLFGLITIKVKPIYSNYKNN